MSNKISRFICADHKGRKRMITYQSKFVDWLEYTLVGVSSDNGYRHILLKEDRTQHEEVIKELRRYVQEAHEDARRHFRSLATGSLNPFEDDIECDPIKGYPEKLHLQTLKGYFGEIFVAIVAENFSPLGITNWEVPAFLFSLHRVAFQHIEAINKNGVEPKPLPGRTGDDCLAFQRDSSGKIIRVLYCEAKCTADHDSDLLSEAHKKVDESIPVDFSAYLEVLRERNTPSARQWVNSLREIWLPEEPIYERYDLISYVCGRHPKRKSTWLLEDEPHKNYKAKRKLEAVETHLYDVDGLIREVYLIEDPAENVMQPERTQQDETTVQPNREALNLARNLRESLAGASISKSLARLYSEHTLLGAGGSGLVSWSNTETTERLNDALRLLEAAFTEREGGNDNWSESIRRAGEIFEWLSHSQLNKDGLPTRFLAAAAYQVAGYPARSSGLLNAYSREEHGSSILKFLLKAEFPNLLSSLSTYWVEYNEKTTSNLSWENPDELNIQLQRRLLKELVTSLSVLCATMRWGEESRSENAIAKLKSMGNVLLHGDDRYSWLLAKLCVEVAEVYIRTSMRYNLTPLIERLTDTGVIALERYLRQCYRMNKALAWPSQIAGIQKLVGEDSFVLCTPTGSGKTTIAELAILQSLFSDTVKNQYLFPPTNSALLAIYLVPSRALATEVESKLSRVLRNLNDSPINITGLYGGTDWGPTDAWLTAGEQTVLICTYEKAEALIRFLGPLFLHRVSLVVLDEAHSIQFDGPKLNLQKADSRALRLETLGSRLFTYLDQSQGRIIALSAMASGIENSLAGWITGQKDAVPAKTSYRSVRQLIGRLECFPGVDGQ
jgi:hypothetical protein